jgi:hypothetical protein
MSFDQMTHKETELIIADYVIGDFSGSPESSTFQWSRTSLENEPLAELKKAKLIFVTKNFGNFFSKTFDNFDEILVTLGQYW